MNNQPARTHGGRRLGAGRKPADTVQLIIRPKVESAAWLRAQARATRQTLGAVVDRLIDTARRP